jgi:hypothetical protein
MIRRRHFLAAACGCALFSLTGCGQTPTDSTAEFFVTSTGQGQVSGYTPQGWGWKPNSKVSIQLWNEPDGRGGASTEWKHLFDVDVDNSSLFGFAGNVKFYPVKRTICGNPERDQTVVFMAKSLTTGRIVLRRAPADIYFTFKPCA